MNDAMIDLTLDGLLIPALPEFKPQFGTKIQYTPENLGGLSTAEVNTNILMAFSKMRPVPVASSAETTAVEYDAKLCFSPSLGSAVTLTLGDGQYPGCSVTVMNTSGYRNTVRSRAGSGLECALEPYGTMRLMWTGSTWINADIKIGVVRPNSPTPGDIWAES